MAIAANGSWYPNLFDRQLEVFNSKARALLVCGPRKSGKCVDGDTIIHTGDGLCRMRRFGPPIEKGDYVLHSEELISFDDKANRLVRASTCGFYRDKATCGLSFEVRGGYRISTSMIHPLWCIVDCKPDYRPASAIQVLIKYGKKVLFPIVHGSDHWNKSHYLPISFLPDDAFKKKRFQRNAAIRKAIDAIPSGRLYAIAKMAGTTYHTVRAFLAKPQDVSLETVTIDDNIGYLLGLLIGDGCLTQMSKKGVIIFSGVDEDIIRKINDVLSAHFHSEPLKHRGGCDWETNSSNLRGFLKSLDMEKYAHEKRIPDEIIESPQSVVRSFLQGIFDTDGTADKKGRVSFCSVSEHLARDVQNLLLAFGLFSNLRTKKTTGRLAWIVELYGDSHSFYEKVGFRLIRKQHRQTLLPTTRRKRHWDDDLGGDYSMNGRVVWREVETCESCSVDLYDVSVPWFHSFVGNGFINHNTWATLHKIVRHLWETPGARVAMFSKTLKNSKEGGTWEDMHRIVLPEWIKAKIGLQYTTKNNEGKPGWKTDGTTRTPYFKITNMHGGESELKLFSLDNDDDIEDKIKEQRFSMIYFSELTKFESRKVLTIALPQLRMPHLRMDQQMWIADTNPGEEGDASWIYQVFYVEKNMVYGEYCRRQGEKPKMAEKTFLNFQKGLQLIEIRPEENPHLPEEELEELKAMYAYDEGLFARYVEGKWVYGDGDSSRHFRGAFSHAVHVLGNASSENEEEWEIISPTGEEVISGWDLGDTNHAEVTLDKPIGCDPKKPHFYVVDEVVSIGENVSIEELTLQVMEKLEALEFNAGKKFLTDRAWSDRSSIEKYQATGDTYPYLEVMSASNDRFFLRGTPKAAGSVRVRVRLLKLLLVEKRFFVSAHCTHTIEMLKHLKRGKTEFVVEDIHKHVFDAITYALLMECAEELEGSMRLNPEKRALDISVPMA